METTEIFFLLSSSSALLKDTALNYTFPATAQQVGYFCRQGGRLVAGGHCQADDVQESLIGSPQVLYFQYRFCNKSKTSLVK